VGVVLEPVGEAGVEVRRPQVADHRYVPAMSFGDSESVLTAAPLSDSPSYDPAMIWRLGPVK
jgi:hypothetical protein